MSPTLPTTIVAPHPDDEVFGVGGVMRELVGRGHVLRIVAVTDGEAAFGPLPTRDRAALVERRDRERAEALDVLGIADSVEVVRLGFPDGDVAAHEDELTARLHELRLGPLTLATWRDDGHPDHDAVGRAAAATSAATGSRLYEYPVWGLARLVARAGARRVCLSTGTRAAKIAAVRAFRSQLDPSPDGRPVVPNELVQQLRTSDEVLLG